MSKETEKRAAYLAALFARMNPHPAANAICDDVAAIQTAARALAALAVKACNEPITTRDEKRRETLKATVESIARSYRLEATVSGDPRGLVVKLWKPGEVDQDGAAGDSFGGGWGVY